MVRTWTTGETEDFTCPHCGSVYAVKIWRSPAREVDSADCEVCKKTMKNWNSTDNPTFTLKMPNGKI